MKDPIGVRRAEAMTTVLLISEGFLRAKIVSTKQLGLAFIGSLKARAAWFGTGLAIHIES